MQLTLERFFFAAAVAVIAICNDLLAVCVMEYTQYALGLNFSFCKKTVYRSSNWLKSKRDVTKRTKYNAIGVYEAKKINDLQRLSNSPA